MLVGKSDLSAASTADKTGTWVKTARGVWEPPYQRRTTTCARIRLRCTDLARGTAGREFPHASLNRPVTPDSRLERFPALFRDMYVRRGCPKFQPAS